MLCGNSVTAFESEHVHGHTEIFITCLLTCGKPVKKKNCCKLSFSYQVATDNVVFHDLLKSC